MFLTKFCLLQNYLIRYDSNRLSADPIIVTYLLCIGGRLCSDLVKLNIEMYTFTCVLVLVHQSVLELYTNIFGQAKKAEPEDKRHANNTFTS